MKAYLNDEKKSVDPRLHLKRVGIISRDHCDRLPVKFQISIEVVRPPEQVSVGY